MVEKIEQLNKRIESLMTQKTKADAQKELCQSNLNEAIVEYAKKYGVELDSKNMENFKKQLENEFKLVNKQVSAEYEKSAKVIACIDKGDIDGAWEAIGMPRPDANVSAIRVDDLESEVAEEQEKDDTVEEPTEEVPEDIEDTNEEEPADEEVVEEKPAFSFSAPVVEDEEEEVVVKPTATKPAFVIEDDEDDDFVTPASTVKEEPKRTLEVDDDEEDNSFGGFKNILSGSKFGDL